VIRATLQRVDTCRTGNARGWRRLPGPRSLLVLALVALPVFAIDPYDPAAPYVTPYLSGSYAEALTRVETELAGQLGLPKSLWLADYAELLFLTGRYDEAITTMGDVVRRVYEPVFTIRLAEMYRHIGRHEDADGAVELAIRQNMSRYPQEYPRENLLAIGKIARWQGENPRSVLQVYQQRLLSRYPDFVRGFVAAGELALDSYGYDVAEGYFLDALEQDPNRQSALAGLAETYHRAEDPRFEEVAERLTALNPHHPRLLALRTERALLAGQVTAASTLIDDLLSINPKDRGGLAFRAAAAFLSNDGGQQAAALARLAEIDPTTAEGYRILGDLAARHYRFEEAVAFLRTGLELDPENSLARASLGLNLLRLGEDATGRVILEEVFDEDPFNVQVYNMLEVLDTLDGFATLTDPEFRVRLPELESQVMGSEVLTLLKEALERYGREYAVEVRRPVFVQLFDDHDEFMVRSIGLPGNPGHLGICFGSLVTLDSPRARDPQSMNWRSVLWHEFVHVITLQKTGNRIPRWLSEGISVHEEHQRDPAWGQPLDPDFQPLLSSEDWPGIEDLERYFVQPQTPTHLILGYFLAGAFVDAFVDTYGKPALVAALDAIREGAAADAALVAAAGADMGAVNRMFAAHLARVCAPLERLAPADEAVEALVNTPPDSFMEHMELGRSARAAGDLSQAAAHFEAAAALFPAIPGEMNPLRELVAIERQSGDLERWYHAVHRLQQHVSVAYEEVFALMEALVRQEAWPRVVELAAWCAGIDPFDIAVLEMRMRAETALGDHEGLIRTLERLAVLDTGRAESYTLARARELRAVNRVSEARHAVLTLLERYPEYREAQQLLLELHDTELEARGEVS
jgi:tetratricopeptide (TPR) repeat protein